MTPVRSELANKMKHCSYTLQSLGYEADVNNTNNLLKIVRRLPLHIKAKWVVRADRIIEGGRVPSFENLCDFIAVRERVANNVFGQDLFLCLCETLLHGGILDSEIKISGFSIIRCDRSSRTGGESVCTYQTQLLMTSVWYTQTLSVSFFLRMIS